MEQKKRIRRHGVELQLHRIGILLARKVCRVVHSNNPFGRYLIKDCFDTPTTRIHTNQRRVLVYQRCYKLSFADEERTVLLIEPKFTPKTFADLYIESVETWRKWTAYLTKHHTLWDMLNTFCRPRLPISQALPIVSTVRHIVVPQVDERDMNEAVLRMAKVLDDEKYGFKVTVGQENGVRYHRRREEMAI